MPLGWPLQNFSPKDSDSMNISKDNQNLRFKEISCPYDVANVSMAVKI